MKPVPGDLTLRLASLGLASLLWFVIAGRQTSERGLAVPVELRNIPRDLELTGEAINAVDVRLRASSGLIDTLDTGRVLATVDLAGSHEGERIVHLTGAQIRVPFGFKVVKITPSLLRLNLESTQHTAIAVKPRIVGRPAVGYELAEVTSVPPTVRIAGPRNRVQGVAEAFTEPVSIAGASAPVQASVNVGLADPLLRLEGASRVQVTAQVREVHETRAFEGLVIEVHGRAALLEPSRATVLVAGPASQVRALDASALQPYVTVPPDTELPGRLPVAVEIISGHPGVTVVETRPAEVSVRAGSIR